MYIEYHFMFIVIIPFVSLKINDIEPYCFQSSPLFEMSTSFLSQHFMWIADQLKVADKVEKIVCVQTNSSNVENYRLNTDPNLT